jgi:hypothetical protein
MRDGEVHSALVWTDEVAGLELTFVTLPAVLTPSGIVRIEDWDLADDE